MSPLKTVQMKLSLAGDPPPEGAYVYLTLDRPDFDAEQVAPQRVTARTDAMGVARFAAWPNARGTRGSHYAARVIYQGRTILAETAVLPDMGGDSILRLRDYFLAPAYPGQPQIQTLVLEAGRAAQRVIDAYGSAEALGDAVQTVRVHAQSGIESAQQVASDLDRVESIRSSLQVLQQQTLYYYGIAIIAGGSVYLSTINRQAPIEYIDAIGQPRTAGVTESAVDYDADSGEKLGQKLGAGDRIIGSAIAFEDNEGTFRHTETPQSSDDRLVFRAESDGGQSGIELVVAGGYYAFRAAIGGRDDVTIDTGFAAAPGVRRTLEMSYDARAMHAYTASNVVATRVISAPLDALTSWVIGDAAFAQPQCWTLDHAYVPRATVPGPNRTQYATELALAIHDAAHEASEELQS